MIEYLDPRYWLGWYETPEPEIDSPKIEPPPAAEPVKASPDVVKILEEEASLKEEYGDDFVTFVEPIAQAELPWYITQSNFSHVTNSCNTHVPKPGKTYAYFPNCQNCNDPMGGPILSEWRSAFGQE